MKASQLLSRTSRSILRQTSLRASIFRPAYSSTALSQRTTTPVSRRTFTTTSPAYLGLQPHSSDPEPPKTESHDNISANAQPADLADSEYHELADQYLNSLVAALEEMAEDPASGMEVEYSAGDLEIKNPKGAWVINKQPPNKQIWLSSPISGPKRFDWVLIGSGQTQKEGTEIEKGDDGNVGGGKWIYIKEGASMTSVLKDELDVEIAAEDEADAETGREGPGGSGGSASSAP